MELADGSGWVSQRLCREPPHNSIVCEVRQVCEKTLIEIKQELQVLRIKEMEEQKQQRDEQRAVRLKQVANTYMHTHKKPILSLSLNPLLSLSLEDSPSTKVILQDILPSLKYPILSITQVIAF